MHSDHKLALAIQEILDGCEWNSETTEKIARLMHNAGYRIRDLNDRDLEEAR